MTVTAKCLREAKFAENSQTTQVTATNETLLVDKATVTNTSGVAATFAVNLVPTAGTAGTSNLIVSRSIAAGATDLLPELVGQTLNNGDFISTLAGTASVLVIRFCGRSVT